MMGLVVVGILMPLVCSVAFASAEAETVSWSPCGLALRHVFKPLAEGKPWEAAPPLREALITYPQEPLSFLTLGTLYLQGNRSALARVAFARAKSLCGAGTPDDLLAEWGIALSTLQSGKITEGETLQQTFHEWSRTPPDTETIAPPPTARAVASTLQWVVPYVQNGFVLVGAATADVKTTERDPVLLELAGFTALRANVGTVFNGQSEDRGAALLQAFVSRPEQNALTEETGALTLSFDPAHPLDGIAGITPIPEIALPAAEAAERTLSGTVTLVPPPHLADDAAFVTYSLEGERWSSATNNPPFVVDWNTARLPNGVYKLHTSVYSADRQLLSDTRRVVRLQNRGTNTGEGGRGQGTRSRFGEREAAALRETLWKLLTPVPSRKAAHFALAQWANVRGDTRLALAEAERTCAIDPDFNDAFSALRHFYLGVLGPREGIWRANTNEKLIALTFDDGPNPLPTRTPALLDALQSVHATATFFVVGARAERAPELLRRMQTDGHEIANHSYSHPNLTQIGESTMRRELCRTSVIVHDATGWRPRFYRPPGGNFNHAVVDAAEALGMSGAYWTVDTIKLEEDKQATPAQVVQFVMGRIRPGAIVLMHNAPFVTTAAIPELVTELRARGYTLVTMSDLVQRTRRTPQPPPAVATVKPSARTMVSVEKDRYDKH